MHPWKKTFFTIWIGQAVSQLTSSILQFAIVWYLTEKTSSGIILSLAMLSGYLPQGLLGPFIGVYIDRFNRKAIMIGADLLIAGVSVLLAIGAVGDAPNIPLILIVLLVRAVGSALHSPTLSAVTPQLVPKEELTRCAGYTQSMQSASMLLSPAVAAMLYSSTSLTFIVLLDIMGAIFACLLLWMCSIPDHRDYLNPPVRQKVLIEAIEGAKILKQSKGLFNLVLVGSLYTVALMPVSALFPLMCMERFMKTSKEAGLVEILFSLGFMIGSVILAKWGGGKNKIHTIIMSFVLMTVSLLGAGLLGRNGFWLFAIFSFFMGVSGPFYWGMYTPLLQSGFEAKYLGRVMSLVASTRYIAGPIAVMIAGVIADEFGTEKWFIIAGVLGAICIVFCMFDKNIRKLGYEDQI